MDDEFYITGLHQGDESVFRELFDRYHNRLCYFATALLTTDQNAEDVVQEAFVKLWQKKGHFHNLPAIKAFLYITVKNHCLNIYKHDRVVRKYGDLLEEEQDADVTVRLIEAEVLETVYQALQKLPSGCRNVLRLSYFEEMKNKEVADHLRISINTVKTQKKRGLQLLRTILKVTSLFL